jgi:uncharacterized protein
MDSADCQEMLHALQNPRAYPEPVGEVQHRETHISHLFLTGRHVYKVKKPVDYGFLDFTTLEKRRHYCHREVELNRRLSPQVYLGVAEVRQQDGGYTMADSGDGPGRTVEYAVKMLQLPAELALTRLLQQDRVSPDDIRRLARKIAGFHARAETGPRITQLGGLAVVWENIGENFSQTEKYIGQCLSREDFDDLVAYSTAFLSAREGAFRRREEQGRVRDGHGDLHSAQIFLETGPEAARDDGISIIDCIEFNDRFRCSDVAEDVAFLAMDLDYHGRPDLSRCFIETYQEAAGDDGVTELLDFFKAYRACVRGKVTSFRLDDPELPAAEQEEDLAIARAYFRLAHSYTRILPSPAVFLVCGLSGTGKSTVAEALARRWNLAYVSSDITRKELAGVDPGEHRYLPPGEGIYSAEFTRRTYDAMLAQALRHLEAGRSVVLDATYRRRDQRARVLEAARRRGADAWVVECSLSDAEARRRLDQRLREGTSVSDGRWEVYQQQGDWEPVAEAPAGRHIVLDTGSPPPEVIQRLLYRLFRSVLEDGESPSGQRQPGT